MSHFTVLVIGDDPERQLAPYHEFECTGRDDEFVQDVDRTAEVRARTAPKAEGGQGESLAEALAHFDFEDVVVASEALVDRAGAHKYRFAVVGDDGQLVRAVRRTNPNKRWDWYVLGGRWSGFFRLLPGRIGALGPERRPDPGGPLPIPRHHDDPPLRETADRALKRDVDFEAMRGAAERDARDRYTKVRAAVGDVPPHEPWDPLRRRFEAEGRSMDAARAAYWAQPGPAALQEAQRQRRIDPWIDLDDYLGTEDEHAARWRRRALSPYAIVVGGEWRSKGEMGWWGHSFDALTQEQWDAEADRLLAAADDGACLSLYDCHI